MNPQSNSLEKTALDKTPKLPIKVDDLLDVWILTYRSGSNPHPLTAQFRFQGNLASCINYARHYCEQVGIRFHSVRPFLTNFEKELRKNLEGLEDVASTKEQIV